MLLGDMLNEDGTDTQMLTSATTLLAEAGERVVATAGWPHPVCANSRLRSDANGVACVHTSRPG